MIKKILAAVSIIGAVTAVICALNWKVGDQEPPLGV